MTNEEIAEATLAYIDENGLEELSFRRLSTHLGIPTMTIYNRFGSKERLLLEVLNVLMRDFHIDVIPDEPWYGVLRRITLGVRRMSVLHPNAFPIFINTSPLEYPIRNYLDDIVAFHASQDLPEGAPQVFLSITRALQVGFFLSEKTMLSGGEGEESNSLKALLNDEAFERDLDIILRGLAVTYGLPFG